MYLTIIVGLFTALGVSFVLILATKWGLLAKYEINRPTWMPSNSCNFCLSWWLGLLFLAPLLVLTQSEIFFFAMFFVPVISRLLI